MNPRPSVGWLLAAVLVFPLVAGAQSQGFDRAARGSLSGRVLFSSSNSPAQHVEVMLAPLTGGMASTVQTDADGEFQFNGLRQGTYILTVHEPGYEQVQETVRVSGMEPGLTLTLQKSGAPPSGQTGDTVSVRELSIPEKARKEFLKGVERREKHDPAGSLPHFQRAIAAYPSYYEAYLQMGFAYNSLGKPEETEKAVRAAVELSSENFADADFALSELLGQENKFDDAEKAARHGVELKPASYVGHFLLGQALYGLHRFKEAEASARKVVSLKRDFAAVHLLLANIHIRTNDAPALLVDLNSYLTLDPEGPAAAQARQLRESIQQRIATATATNQ
jgi:tetratricopeptide (TPR) repeat protein